VPGWTETVKRERIDWTQFELLKKVKVREVLEYLRTLKEKDDQEQGFVALPRSRAPWEIAKATGSVKNIGDN
jgi:hypothetical protein